MAALASGLPTVALGSEGCFGVVTEENGDDAAFCNFGGFGLSGDVPAAEVYRQLGQLATDADRYRRLSRFGHDLIVSGFRQDDIDRRYLHVVENGACAPLS